MESCMKDGLIEKDAFSSFRLIASIKKIATWLRLIRPPSVINQVVTGLR